MRPKMAAIARQAWENRAGVSTHPKTNMTMENPPSEDVFPIENGDFHLDDSKSLQKQWLEITKPPSI